MKEYYGARELHPLDYPIRSYEEQMAECKGMYDCHPAGVPATGGTIENFGPFGTGAPRWLINVAFVILGFFLMRYLAQNSNR